MHAKVARLSGKPRKWLSRTTPIFVHTSELTPPSDLCMPNSKRIVYILKSADEPPRYYVGLTADLSARLAAHNAGRCHHTAAKRPWRVDVLVKFADEARAVAFERYLKSGSGNAFAMRHFR